MSKAAVMQGVYVDCKFMPGLKSARIAIDIPIEHSNEFLRMFGAPDRANPVAVAIARLDVGALNAPPVPEKAVEPAKVEKAETKRFCDLPRSQQAALKLRDGSFVSWIRHRYCDQFGLKRGEDMDANRMLKVLLGIDSKRELDNPESGAVAAFDRLLTSFEFRDQVRA